MNELSLSKPGFTVGLHEGHFVAQARRLLILDSQVSLSGSLLRKAGQQGWSAHNGNDL